MRINLLASACVLFLSGSLYSVLGQSTLAERPPMGWNSWDAYGLTINESEFKDNARWMAAHLKQFGWTYAVVDEGWYVVDPTVKPALSEFVLTTEGLYYPAAQRYPSAAKPSRLGSGPGFKPIADFVHGLGLQFGIHIIRGIPKQAVAKNTLIAGSQFRAGEAADTSDTCPWNTYNYGVKNNPAGQAYYDAQAALYASWGVDFLKVDCISSHPYKEDEIRMVSEALKKTGRPIVLSLSPGPAPLASAQTLAAASQMWRISDDVWDHWGHDPKMSFSQGIADQFAVAASWARYAGPGHWPDADMLPIGFLGPRPGEASARRSRLTATEQKTLITGWSIFHSPLILGANLTKMDDDTLALITNPEVIAVDQASTGQHEAMRERGVSIWTAQSGAGGGTYVAVFNLSDAARPINYAWTKLGLLKAPHSMRDLWERRDTPATNTLQGTLAPHATVLYRVQ